MKETSLQLASNLVNFNNYGCYKKAIKGSTDYLYLPVTRVNYLTANLWLTFIKNEFKKKNIENKFIPDKVNWLVMLRAFRREQEFKLTTTKTK